MRRTATILAFFGWSFAAAQAAPPAPATGPNIAAFEITHFRGGQLKSRLTVDSLAAPGQHEVAIYLIDGDTRTEVWKRTLDFPAKAGGGRYLAELDLTGKALRGRALEAVLTACQATPTCSRQRVELNTGDVQIVGSPSFPHLGRVNLLLQNFGPADSPKCSVEVTINRQYHRTLPLKPMVVNQDWELTFTYDQHHRNRPLAATVKCEPADLATANNHRYLGSLP